MSQLKYVLAVCAVVSCVAACGGGGGGSDAVTVIGLSAPNQMQVVTVDDGALPPPLQANLPPDCDYVTDPASRHVFDPSMEAIQQVNSILCYVGQVGGAEMVNLGPYNAQIDTAKCENGEDSSNSGQGQSSGSNAQQPEIWVVDSSRASNVAPQIVHIWLPSHDDGADGTIQVSLEIDKAPSATLPFGQFALNFAMVTNTDPITAPREFGSLGTLDGVQGLNGFTFYNQKGDVNQLPAVDEEHRTIAAVVEMSADQSTGSARVSNTHRRNDSFGGDTGILTDEFQIAFDTNDVMRGHDADPPVCLSRTDYHVNTWRYNLYDANTGERVELNSGFPFETTNGDHGWLGYWGLWVPTGVTVNNGDTITQVEYGNNTTADYTVVKAPGKLVKHTRNTLDLLDGEGESFEWWDFSTPPGTRFRVTLSSSLFYEVASWDDASQSWTDLPSPVLIDTSTHNVLQMWSQSLGGSVTYVDGDTFVTYFAQQFINGSSSLFATAIGGVVKLYGFDGCLRSGLLANEVEAGDVYLPPAPNIATPYVFQVDQSDLTLMHDVNGDGSQLTQVGLANGEVPSVGPFVWGMSSSPMVTDTAGLVNTWDIWSQDVFYTYETGANEWNHYTAAVDLNGDYVTFDAPLQFTYTHTTAADANSDTTYDNKKYLIGYGGPGSLWGIPQTSIDFDGDGNPDRFLPAFSIADGTVMGPNGTEYLIRAIDSELTLGDNTGQCGALDLNTAAALTLPDGTTYVMPDIGPAPTVTAPPAVIYGEVQGN